MTTLKRQAGDGPSIRVLGPVSLSVPGRAVRLSRLESGLVACLALHEGRGVAVPTMAGWLWQDPPASVRNRVQALVSGVRRATGRSDLVVTEPSGYRLGPGVTVDVTEWNAAIERARRIAGDGRGSSVAVYRDALALWTGPPLDRVPPTDRFGFEAARLAENRVEAQEACLAAELAAGGGAHLVLELTALCAEHPFRERLHVLLMWALAAAGRRSDAVRVYRETQHRLSDELGIQPCRELQAALARILSDPGASRPQCSAIARVRGRVGPRRLCTASGGRRS
jgi:DNA-binding SARP family transcriptional activator